MFPHPKNDGRKGSQQALGWVGMHLIAPRTPLKDVPDAIIEMLVDLVNRVAPSVWGPSTVHHDLTGQPEPVTTPTPQENPNQKYGVE